MGISGLLPLLKPIQVNKNLSDFSGQTIAVDAYVWLHRGAYACAAELATGKRTTRYVDYAMHLVRLLLHHNITPYIVFDGGPLPAKKGTEADRKKRREENLARAKALVAQGKHSQAREFYVKCVDVTPQMAYQLIKALRAEDIAYVVAPYEADAQMAYLERIGLVDGILTEDSDLLVFGCKNVLLKLDSVANTVIAISRADFAKLDSTSKGGISLLGWSDNQFRAMAILSGCDYLPSIPGVGLKTAWSLLRKHKSVENVVRALRMEGKKDVPRGYLEAFKLAEEVFLHQRVYDPPEEKLVNLTKIFDIDWNADKETHVGRYIEPSLAKKVAEGDVCPVSLRPMVDINPAYVPRSTQRSSTKSKVSVAKDKLRMSTPKRLDMIGILNFFAPTPKVSDTAKQSSSLIAARPISQPVGTVGRSSGKRRLVDIMDRDVTTKRKRQEELGDWGGQSQRVQVKATSKYFHSINGASAISNGLHVAKAHDTSDTESVPGPSDLGRNTHNKENIPISDNELEDGDVSGEISLDDEPDPVTQEDGYMSPPPRLLQWDSPELSSPVRTRGRSDTSKSNTWDDDFDADRLSSPQSSGKNSRFKANARRDSTPSPPSTTGKVLVHGTPSSEKRMPGGRDGVSGPDLRDIFEDWDDLTSEIDEQCDDSPDSTPSSGGPFTPSSLGQGAVSGEEYVSESILDDSEDEEAVLQTARVRQGRVATGWWKRWNCGSPVNTARPTKLGTLRRSETTVTSEGHHRPCAPQILDSRRMSDELRAANGKSRLTVVHEEKSTPADGFLDDVNNGRPGGSSESEGAEDVLSRTKRRLSQFRYMAA